MTGCASDCPEENKAELRAYCDAYASGEHDDNDNDDRHDYDYLHYSDEDSGDDGDDGDVISDPLNSDMNFLNDLDDFLVGVFGHTLDEMINDEVEIDMKLSWENLGNMENWEFLGVTPRDVIIRAGHRQGETALDEFYYLGVMEVGDGEEHDGDGDGDGDDEQLNSFWWNFTGSSSGTDTIGGFMDFDDGDLRVDFDTTLFQTFPTVKLLDIGHFEANAIMGEEFQAVIYTDVDNGVSSSEKFDMSLSSRVSVLPTESGLSIDNLFGEGSDYSGNNNGTITMCDFLMWFARRLRSWYLSFDFGSFRVVWLLFVPFAGCSFRRSKCQERRGKFPFPARCFDNKRVICIHNQ